MHNDQKRNGMSSSPMALRSETERTRFDTTASIVEPKSHPEVTCVVLNWNGWADTIECLDALKECSCPHLTIVVVDNGSTDDSVARIKAANPDILLLKSENNRGF